MSDDDNIKATESANKIMTSESLYKHYVRVSQAWLDAVTPRPLDDWCEGCVLWWRLPVEEPPYCGEPGDSGWIEDYYTHWTPLVCPMAASDKIKKASKG
jgi:hypothetical protein